MVINTKKIKLFIPPIVFKIKWHKKKSEKIEFSQSPIPTFQPKSSRMIILGNGPTLNISIEKYEKEILKYDRIAVNFFASTNLYKRVRPNYYLFADPAFFYIPDNQKNSMSMLFNTIVTQTEWNMHILVPLSAKDSTTVSYLKENTKISVDFYSDYNQDIGQMPKYEAWDKNYLCPPGQTVINTALYLSLYWNYPETYLVGTDMSVLEDIRIDQETNELFSIDRHFYNNKDVYSDKKLFDEKRGRIRSDWKLHEYIYAYGRMFEYFYDLKGYADYKGLKVYNASEYSWINVFERKKLI